MIGRMNPELKHTIIALLCRFARHEAERLRPLRDVEGDHTGKFQCLDEITGALEKLVSEPGAFPPE
jgi:hypothetical protein